MTDMSDGKVYDYDLIIVGGGSGGIAACKEAASFGKKVALFDFVVPSPQGTTWGLGGTCVNVGCIPKKLMHKAALLGKDLQDATYYGWETPEQIKHDWSLMVSNVQNYIKSMNFGYRKLLKEINVCYFNAYVEFIDSNTIKATDKKKEVREVTAHDFVIAVGGRPRYPEIPGAKEFGITSDDLFSLTYFPGKTVIVGGSYIALECAGILNALGVECTLMIRSIFLRGFDQQMANLVGNHIESLGVTILKEYVPTKIEQVSEGEPGRYLVFAKHNNDEEIVQEYNTVIFAIGRNACTKNLGLENVGVELNQHNGKIVTCDGCEQSATKSNIFAIGDCMDGNLELTPVAVEAGKLLARRIFTNSREFTDYTNVPTTVFTPFEYGCVGLSEEDSIQKYGENDIEVYHSHFQPLELVLPNRDVNVCYGKLICVKSDQERVVGLHVFGPNAGEITQGFALGVKLGAKKKDFDSLIGIHPTSAEMFTTLDITRASGKSTLKSDC